MYKSVYCTNAFVVFTDPRLHVVWTRLSISRNGIELVLSIPSWMKFTFPKTINYVDLHVDFTVLLIP